MNRTLGPGVGLGIGLLTTLLLVNALVSYRNVHQLDEDARWVAHTHEVLDALEEVLAAVRDAEAAQRGYLLAGESADLIRSQVAAATALARVNRVAELTADNQSQQARVPHLRAAVAAETATLRQTAALAEGGDPTAAVQRVRAGDVRELAAEIQGTVGAMEEEERGLLRVRESASHQSYSIAVGSGIAAAALGLASIVLLALLIGRHRRAEERSAADLAAERERFRATFEQAAVGVAHVAPDGRWLRVNRRLCDLLGYAPEEMAGLTLQDVTDPADLGRQLAMTRRMFAGELNDFSMEKRCVRKGGSRVWANLTVSLVRRPDGSPDYCIAVIEDISARKQLEDQVRQHAADLERRVDERTRELRDANAALEAFGYSVSHDLRAPLRNMQALAHALVEDYSDRLDAGGREFAERIAQAGQQMDRLILGLLAFSRLSRAELPLGPVELGGAVAEARSRLADSIRASGASLAVEEPLPTVVGHRPTLVHVVTNLLDNALKFVPPGAQPRVRLWAERAGDRVRLWVEDQGIGIAPEHREKIFGVFERLHGEEAYPGTGIGLAIVQKGAERMGGRAGVEAPPGGGSRFWVELNAYSRGERGTPDGPDGRGQRDGRPDGDAGVR